MVITTNEMGFCSYSQISFHSFIGSQDLPVSCLTIKVVGGKGEAPERGPSFP